MNQYPIQMVKTLSIILGLSLNMVLHADTASTTQNLIINIPVVALLDLQNLAPAFTLTPPNNAGEGFSVISANNQSNIAISSNNANTKLLARIDQNLSSYGFSLHLSGIGLGSCYTNLILNTVDQSFCNVGKIQTTTGAVTIDLDTSSGNQIAAHGSYTLEVIYTLTND